MSTYVIGDIQGCHGAFLELLDALEFDPARDKAWITGKTSADHVRETRPEYYQALLRRQEEKEAAAAEEDAEEDAEEAGGGDAPG